MTLAALLGDIDSGWYAGRVAGTDDRGVIADAIDPVVLRSALGSPLGQRVLARWLLEDAAASHLLAPQPDGGVSRIPARWPRHRLGRLMRDLGVLAFAPAIRAEVRREPVRTLKRVLGNGYLLALDKAIWNGQVDTDIATRLHADLHDALANGESTDIALHALFDTQGDDELRAWAAHREPALAEWLTLQSPPKAAGLTHLPEKQVLFLHAHHAARDGLH